ncbi:MAG TPA: colicin immunity domain-containing protein [Hyphomonadaceae bacterium]|nr:colicin immunity domain-containing protein [Hyphomonadaceae bacterium]
MSRPMTNPSDRYKKLLDSYIDGRLSTEEFCRQYDEAFLADDTMFEPALYDILNDLFVDTDALTSNPALIAERPTFYVNEKEFRERAELAAARLDRWRDGKKASGE